jgi:hypothetical protein
MAGGALALVQPGDTFGLQVSNRAIDRLVNLLRSCAWNRVRFVSQSRERRIPEEATGTKTCEPWIDFARK